MQLTGHTAAILGKRLPNRNESILIDLSIDPDAICRPVGSNLVAKTSPECPVLPSYQLAQTIHIRTPPGYK
jgi:hypothetical protein